MTVHQRTRTVCHMGVVHASPSADALTVITRKDIGIAVIVSARKRTLDMYPRIPHSTSTGHDVW